MILSLPGKTMCSGSEEVLGSGSVREVLGFFFSMCSGLLPVIKSNQCLQPFVVGA